MTEYKLELKHWETSKAQNIDLILQCKMQIEMAELILIMVDKKIAEFPKVEVKPKV